MKCCLRPNIRFCGGFLFYVNMKEYKRGKHNPTIGMSPEEVTNYWVSESIKKFGNKFDYSKVGTIKIKKDKALIGCPIHGFIETSFVQHLKNEGCPQCGDRKGRDSKRMKFDEFLDKLEQIHPNKSWKIISRKFNGRQIKHEKVYTQDEFGICKIGVSILLNGGAPSIKSACFKNLYAERMYRKSIGYNGLHFNKTEYKISLDYIKVNCHTHGEYSSKPNWIISSKRGCPKCFEDRRHLCLRSNTKTFINKAIKRLGTNREIYNKVEYTHAKEKVPILCEVHNEYYMITPNDHLTGYGCPECGIEQGGYSRSDYVRTAKGRDATLYLLKCFNNTEDFYKVGITLVTIKERYSKSGGLPYNYEILYQFKGEAGSIWDAEKSVLRFFKPNKYSPLINFQGYTECFNKKLQTEDVKNHIIKNFNTFFLHN